MSKKMHGIILNTYLKRFSLIALASSLMLSACSLGQVFGPPIPTVTQISTSTPPPTLTPTPTQTPTITPSPTPTLMGGFAGEFITVETAQEIGFVTKHQAEVILWNQDGSDNRVLWNSPADLTVNDLDARWSPTGEVISIEYWEDGGYLLLLRPDGTEIITIRTGIHIYGGANGQANWSPDGNWIVFSGMGDRSYADIYRVSADGENLVQLTNTPMEENGPIFTPDGKHIVYRDDKGSLYIMDFDGSNQKLLMSGPASIDDWSPDGKTVLLQKSNDIYMMDFETQRLSQLTFDGKNTIEFNDSISPDGQSIIFTTIVYYSDTDHSPGYVLWGNLFIMPADGSRKPVLLGETDLRDRARFTPNGKLIIFDGWQINQDPHKDTPHFYAMHPDGSGLMMLSDNDLGLVYGKWRPGSALPAISQVSSIVVTPTPTPISTWNPFSIDKALVKDIPLVKQVVQDQKFDDISSSNFEISGNFSRSTKGNLVLGQGSLWSDFRVKQNNGYLLLFRTVPDTNFIISFEFGPFYTPSYHAFWLEDGDHFAIYNGTKITHGSIDFHYLAYTSYYLMMWLDTNGVKGIIWQKDHPEINKNFYADTGTEFTNSKLNFVVNIPERGKIEIDEFQELEFAK